MNCCTNCFDDLGLQSRIESQSNGKGNCDFCESKDLAILRCEDLSTFFEVLFDMYVNNPTSKLSLKINKAVPLYEHLLTYWPKLFNHKLLKEKDIKQLVNQIGRGWEAFNENLFEHGVELQIYMKGETSDDTYSLQWETFAREIKNNNRFFLSETLDLEKLEVAFNRFAKTYPAGTNFFRARISDTPLPKTSLGKPPKDSTIPGRANPVGIPYLYLSESEETTLYETRVSLHEAISVGIFLLKAPLNVISLKGISNYGPFEIQDRGFDLEEFMLIRPYLVKLEEELSKPVRKQDINLDYLPTQYLCEFIKSLGFDAVEYRSAMANDGYNLAVFNDLNIECMSTNHYQIKGLKYNWK